MELEQALHELEILRAEELRASQGRESPLTEALAVAISHMVPGKRAAGPVRMGLHTETDLRAKVQHWVESECVVLRGRAEGSSSRSLLVAFSRWNIGGIKSARSFYCALRSVLGPLRVRLRNEAAGHGLVEFEHHFDERPTIKAPVPPTVESIFGGEGVALSAPVSAVIHQPPAPTLPDNVVRFSLVDVATITGLSRSSLYQRIAEGRLRIVKDGRRVFVERSELQRYLSCVGDALLGAEMPDGRDER